MVHAFVVLAQNTQEGPEDGVGIGLVLATIVLIVLLLTAVFTVVRKRTKATRGGIEPAGEQRKGDPPLESVRRGD